MNLDAFTKKWETDDLWSGPFVPIQNPPTDKQNDKQNKPTPPQPQTIDWREGGNGRGY